MTPQIPDWIREYRCPQELYRSIYEYAPEEPRLYGTESMFGDWSGELLLLAQDFCSKSHIQRWINDGRGRLFQHDPCLRTNINLEQLTRAIEHRMLYGSVFAGLLRDSKSNSGTLPPYTHLLGHLSDILHFTMNQMPNLRGIACMGKCAWMISHASLGVDAPPWRLAMANRQTTVYKGVTLFPLGHPAWAWRHHGSKDRAFADWAWMNTELISPSDTRTKLVA